MFKKKKNSLNSKNINLILSSNDIRKQTNTILLKLRIIEININNLMLLIR